MPRFDPRDKPINTRALGAKKWALKKRRDLIGLVVHGMLSGAIVAQDWGGDTVRSGSDVFGLVIGGLISVNEQVN
jgi:hypothetical protein